MENEESSDLNPTNTSFQETSVPHFHLLRQDNGLFNKKIHSC